MTVGNQATVASINQALTSYALTLRNICQQIVDLQQFVNGPAGLGLTGLQNLGGTGAGFPAADAQLVLNMVGYLNTVAGVFYGTVQQGGTGGTGATLFNFSNALAPLSAGG